jgi:hypothetical protein
MRAMDDGRVVRIEMFATKTFCDVFYRESFLCLEWDTHLSRVALHAVLGVTKVKARLLKANAATTSTLCFTQNPTYATFSEITMLRTTYYTLTLPISNYPKTPCAKCVGYYSRISGQFALHL